MTKKRNRHKISFWTCRKHCWKGENAGYQQFPFLVNVFKCLLYCVRLWSGFCDQGLSLYKEVPNFNDNDKVKKMSLKSGRKKGENACLLNFLLLPQCFIPNQGII